jgi:hypothetical protein
MLHYGELDRMYSELLKIAIDKPHLRNPNVTQTDEQKREYEYYAQMVWCFVETIYDRATPDNQLLEIWYTAAEVENRLHREGSTVRKTHIYSGRSSVSTLRKRSRKEVARDQNESLSQDLHKGGKGSGLEI